MTQDSYHNGKNDIELLSFEVACQEYCVDITSVREIRGWTKATPLPYSPDHIKGVINLRGTVLPIIDLSARLGMGMLEPGGRNVIIVVNVNGDSAGLLVDDVSDILTVSRNELHTPPEIGSTTVTRFIQSFLVSEERMIRVLDLATVLPKSSKDAA